MAGFGRIVDLKPEQFLTDLSGAQALLEAEKDVIDHMNADHLDTMKLYATGCSAPRTATGAAPAAIRMASTCRPAANTLRLDFPQRIATAAALRQTLKQHG